MSGGAGRDDGFTQDKQVAAPGGADVLPSADAGQRVGASAGVLEDDGAPNMTALLQALARVAREEEAESASSSWDAAPPLGESLRKSITERILAAQTAEKELPRAASRSIPRSIASARPKRAFLVGGAGLLAAAAALVLVVHPMRRQARSPLPEYQVTASGGLQEVRGGAGPDDGRAAATAAVQRLAPESELVVLARPQTGIAEPVAVRVFLTKGTQTTEVRPAVRVAASGAVELRLAGGALFSAQDNGAATLHILVGRPATVERLDGTRLAAPATDADVRSLTVPLLFVGQGHTRDGRQDR